MTKQQKQLIVLGAIVLLTIIVLLVRAFDRPEVLLEEASGFTPKEVNVDLEAKVLQHPEYRDLTRPNVKLPVEPVETGRSNPFIPF